MAGEQFGYSNAFNVRTNASQTVDNQINDLNFADRAAKENQALAAAKTAMMLQDVDFQNGSNPYDEAIIKKENQALLQDIGRFTRENPDWTTNVDKAAQLKFKKQQFKSSPAVLRSVAYKEAVGEYNKYLQVALKSPTKYNLDQLDAFKQKMDNYNKTGNGDGLADKEGAKPLVFTPPAEIPDLEDLHRKAGDSMNPTVFSPLNNGRDGAYTGIVDEESLKKKAIELYSQNKDSYDYVYGKNGQEPVGSIMNAMRPYIKSEYHIGDRNPVADALAIESGKARIKAALDAKSAGKQVDPYALLLNDRYTKDDPKDLAATFGTNVPYYFTDATGNIVKGQGDDFNYEGTIFDKGYNKDKKYERTGIKVTPGYVEKPLDWAKEQGFLTKPFWGDPEVKPEFADRVKIVTGPIGKDGEAPKIVQLKAFNEIAANSPKYALKYNKQFATTKQRDALGINESMLESDDTYEGRPIGSVVQTSKGNYLVTPQGYVKQ